MAKSKGQTTKSKNSQQGQKGRALLPYRSTPRSGPSVLTPPRLNMASNVGRQSEIALPVRKGLSDLTIHPDNTRWLGEAAPSFQRWGMTDLTLWYEPRVATSVNGQIAIAFLSDFADRLPDSLEDTVTLSGAQRGSPWSRFQLPKQKNRLYDYCSLSDFGLDGVTSMADRSPGRIVVWADMDSTFGDDDIIGWVYISYKPVLHDPILRKMQVTGGSGGGVPSVPRPPAFPGQSGYTVADYYYKERAYTTAYDFMGLNPNYNNEMLSLTPRVGYVYSDKIGYNAVVNTSANTVRVYFECILRDFSLFSTPKSLTFKTWGTTLFPGNKGNYTAWANGDVLLRFVGDIEPNGWFYYDNSILTSWAQSEVYIMELGLENGVQLPPLKQPTFDWGVTSTAVSFAPEVATAIVSSVPSFAKKMATSTRNSNYVGLSGYADGSKELVPGVSIFYNGASAHSGFGGTNPTNRLGMVLRNDTGSTKVFYINVLTSAWATNYSTTPLTPVVFGTGSINFATTSDTAHVCCVTLSAGAALGWTMALRSSSFNGGSAVESVGDVFLTLQLGDSYFPQN